MNGRMAVMVLMLISLFNVDSFCSKADVEYPLEPLEEIVEERVIDDDNVELFTKNKDDYYLKTFKKIEGEYIVIETTRVEIRKTGVKDSDVVGSEIVGRWGGGQYECLGLETEAVRVDYSESPFLPPVGEQYENSCVGWAVGYYLRTFQEAKELGWRFDDVEDIELEKHVMSPSYIYNLINGGVDNGATLIDGCELVKNYGAATMEEFPYIKGDYRRVPDENVKSEAYCHRIKEWQLLFDREMGEVERVKRLKSYLRTGDLVVVGGKVGFKFFYPFIDDDHNSIITQESRPLTRHAYVVVGYDDEFETFDGKGAFKLVNSWGTQWGDDGFSYISYEAFAKNTDVAIVFADVETWNNSEVLRCSQKEHVRFDIGIQGAGIIGADIENLFGEQIYRMENIEVESGSEGKDVTSLVWTGIGDDGICAEEGMYKLCIYNIDRELENRYKLYEKEFEKCSVLRDVTSTGYLYEEDIRFVEVKIKPVVDVRYTVGVKAGGRLVDIVLNQEADKDVEEKVRIEQNDFDFNQYGIDEVEIIVEVTEL